MTTSGLMQGISALCTAAFFAAWQIALIRSAASKASTGVRPFEKGLAGKGLRLLVIGDSTGVGNGSSVPESSLAGLVAHELNAVQVVNRCRNGARVADATEQIHTTALEAGEFDLVLILVGGNDVLRGTALAQLEQDAQGLLQALGGMAKRSVWMGCADIGRAPMFLPPLSWWFSWRTTRVMRVLARQAKRFNVDFVDFARGPHHERIVSGGHHYFAADGVHPSSAAYRYCFQVVMQRPVPAALRNQP